MDASELQQERKMAVENLRKAAKGIDKTYYEAVADAKHAAYLDGFFPNLNADGELVHTVPQALKAACWTREDTSATLVIQRSALRYLIILTWMGAAALALLVYIAMHMH